MKSAAPVFAALLLALPAFADDDPKPAPAPGPAPAPAPSDGAAPKPEAKKERKVDPAGAKAVERYTGLVHLPVSSGMKAVTAKGDYEENGLRIGLNPKWSTEKGFDFDVTLDAETTAKIVEQGVPEEEVPALVKGQLAQLVGFGGFNSAFEAPGKNWEHYDIAVATQGDDEIVTLTQFDDQADAATRKYTFGKDGLLKSISVDPKDDPNNPQIQMIKSAGITFDSTVGYEKRGDRSLIASRTLTIGPQQIDTKFAYYGGESGPYLLRDATVSLPDGDRVIHFHDYVVDGKPVESTKSVSKAPAEAPKAPEKPAEPAPAPVPAPKDEPK